MANQNVIGKNNQLPWRLPEDLKHFRALTLNHTVVMGKNTFLSIAKALPERRNLVLTRDKSFKAEDIEVFHDIESLLAELKLIPDTIFVIGGATIYQQLLPFCTTLYITQIDADIDGDTFFPEINLKEWQEKQRISITKNASTAFDYHFLTLQRI